MAEREPERLDRGVEYLRAIAPALMGVNARLDKIIELLGGEPDEEADT
jgi:hypothetical protein